MIHIWNIDLIGYMIQSFDQCKRQISKKQIHIVVFAAILWGLLEVLFSTNPAIVR